MMEIPTRLAQLPRWAVAALLVLVAAFAVWSAIPPAGSAPRIHTPGASAGIGDQALYRSIVARMREGNSYYPTVAAAHRAHDYPLTPFFAVRLPTLATVQSILPPAIQVALLWALVASAVGVWAWRVRQATRSNASAIGAIGLLVIGMYALTLPGGTFHEDWAAALIALSLGLWRPDRLWPSLLAAGAALAIRELAIVLPLAMICAAAIDRRWREVAAWVGLIALFAAYVAWHASMVAAIGRPGDLVSPGWSGMLGWNFVVAATGMTSAVRLFPLPVAGVLLALSLAGWAAWRDARALRVTGTLIGFALFIGLFGRPDTFYWALLFAPLSMMGLIFVPALVADGVAALRSGKERA